MLVMLAFILIFSVGMRPVPDVIEAIDSQTPPMSENTNSSNLSASEPSDGSVEPSNPDSSSDSSEFVSSETSQSTPKPDINSVGSNKPQSSSGAGLINGGASNSSGSISSGSGTPSGGQSGSSGSQQKPSVPSPSPAPTPTPAGKAVVGYYTGWSSYKGYTPSKVPTGKLTHLNYAFAKIDPATSQIALADPTNDRKNFAAIRTLKQNNRHLKALISVGGWDYSTYFSDIASTSARREAFAQSCLDFILEHGFDGVDLDWDCLLYTSPSPRDCS